MYLDDVYHIEGYTTLGNNIWKALEDEKIENLVKSFNLTISCIPYEDFENRDEFWYRSLFVMLLRGAGVIYFAEVYTFRGRPDVVEEQIKSRDYSSAYEGSNEKVINLVLIADDEKIQLVL